jgi:two-component system LytT family response regulator
MNRLRAILVDDERLARQQLSKLLQAQSGVCLVGQAANLTEAIDLLNGEPPDVVFLDISMPPESGFDLLPHVPLGTRVVFVTAHAEHAIHAFEAKALDYLLKPVLPERLAQTIEHLHEMALLQIASASVVLGDRRSWEKIPVEAISAVMGDGNYSSVHTLAGSDFFVRRPMREWEELLATSGFVMLSRSLLVNPAAFSRLEVVRREEALLHLIGVPDPIPLGRTATLRARRQLKEGRRAVDPG